MQGLMKWLTDSPNRLKGLPSTSLLPYTSLLPFTPIISSLLLSASLCFSLLPFTPLPFFFDSLIVAVNFFRLC